MEKFITFAKNVFATCFVIIAAQITLFSQTYPADISQSNVVTGLSNPTAMAFAADGRIFICQQGGILRVVKDGALLSPPFISLTVNSSGERGLLGVAFDPNFSTNNYIYLYYTTSSSPIHNRVSRFTADGDVVAAGSELEILNLENLSATNHNGGSIAFGPDGKLYVAVGENASASNSQSISNRLGKILRINADGTIPADNPAVFPGIAGSTTGLNQVIWSVGLRNPYTIAFQPVTGKLFVNDVGQVSKEEINENTVGGLNFGWSATEGVFDAAAFPNFTNPIYDYGRSGTANSNGLGCAITGGAFFNPTTTNFPSEYIGTYFFLDLCGRWIDKITLSQSVPVAGGRPQADVWTRSNFASNISGSPVDLKVGPDGNLYYLSRSAGALVKIIYTAPVLPVKLLSFEVKSIDNESVALTWITSSENNADKFEVQKLVDQGVWKSIGEVKALGNTSEKATYKLIDDSPNNGVNYYRLKQFDLNGKFEYSKTVAYFYDLEDVSVRLFPNPSENSIEVEGLNIQKERIEIFNSLGQNVSRKVIFKSQTIIISSLPKGKYFIKTPKKTLAFYKN